MSVLRVSQCCEHCLSQTHCNRHFKVRCHKFLNFISHLHKSNAHQELISELKSLIDTGSKRPKYSFERRI